MTSTWAASNEMHQHGSYGLGKQDGQKHGGLVRVNDGFPVVRYPSELELADIPFKQLVSWQGERNADPIPVVVSVELGGRSPGDMIADIPTGIVPMVCPPPFNDLENNYQATLLVEYQVRGVRRRRWIDPREGTYQLPPCTQVTVSLRAYQVDGESTPPKYGLAVSLAAGTVEGTREASYSGFFRYLGIPDVTQFWFPPGAYAARVSIVEQVSAADIVVTVEGVQPEVVIGPGALQAPGPSDLIRVLEYMTLHIDGGDPGKIYVETLLSW